MKSAHYPAVGAKATSHRSETTVTEMLETEQVKRSIFKTILGHFVRSEKPDYARSATFR